MAQINEYEIIRGVKQGDQKAFEKIVNAYRSMIYSLCARMLNVDELAQEVAQDVFIKFYFTIDRFNFNAKICTYLYRIAYNKCIDQIRKRKYDHVGEEIFDQLPDNDHNPEIEIEKGEEKKILDLAIDSLSQEERTLIEFHYFNKLPIKEIAEILDLSISNFKIKMLRTRKKLEKQIISFQKKGVTNA